MQYHPKLKSSLAVASVLVLIFNAIPNLCTVSATVRLEDDQATSSKQDYHTGVSPGSDEFSFGPFFMNRTYSQRSYSDRLRLSKSYIRYQIKTPFTGELNVVDYKLKIREHLLRCDNLTLLDAALNSELDCQPIEFYLSNYIDTRASPPSPSQPPTPSKATTNIAEFVKKTTIENKGKVIGDFPFRHELVLYPLKNEHTELKIESILEKNNLTKPLNFATPINLGYQVEINYFTVSKFEKYLTCTGQMYLSVNASKPLLSDRCPNETYPEILHKYEDLFNAAADNGYLLSFRNLSCYQPTGPLNFVTVENNFDVIHKNEFPYFTLTHTSWLEPLRNALDYKAVINQVKISEDSDDTNLSYNTTTHITSSSTVLKLLDFKLDQTNTNSPSKGFTEEMITFSKNHLLRIAATRNETIFHKILKLYLFDLDALKGSGKHEVSESARLVLMDLKAEDGPTLCLNLKRNLANSLFGYPQDPFWPVGEAEENNDIESEKPRLDL